MDDPLLVCGFQGLGDLLRNRQRFVHWNRSMGDAVGERRSVDQLHNERLHTLRLLQTVHVRDVGMVE